MRIQKIASTPMKFNKPQDPKASQPQAPVQGSSPAFKGMHIIKCEPQTLGKFLPVFDEFAPRASGVHCSLEKAEEAVFGLHFMKGEEASEMAFFGALSLAKIGAGLKMLTFKEPTAPLAQVIAKLEESPHHVGFGAEKLPYQVTTVFDEIILKAQQKQGPVGFKLPETKPVKQKKIGFNQPVQNTKKD